MKISDVEIIKARYIEELQGKLDEIFHNVEVDGLSEILDVKIFENSYSEYVAVISYGDKQK